MCSAETVAGLAGISLPSSQIVSWTVCDSGNAAADILEVEATARSDCCLSKYIFELIVES